VYNAVSIVGANAKAADSIGVADVLLGLSYAEGAAASDTTATTTLEGDTYKISKSSDPLNLYEYLVSSGHSGELENGPISRVTSSELNALADGSISNEKGTFTYDQRIYMPDNASVTYAVDDDQSDDPAFYLKFPDTTKVYEYRLTFGSPLKSDIDDSYNFEDLDNKKISMLGKEYTIINTDNRTGENTIELMAGSIQDTLSEGESKTYTINGIDYVTEVIIITDTGTSKVKFKINGETTDALEETQTFKLTDGTEIGVKEILANEAGDVTQDLVEFYLGAEKITIKDDTIDSTENWDATIDVGADSIDAVGDIIGSFQSSGTDVSISKLRIKWTADEDYYVPIGGKLSDQLDEDYKGNLFLENMDFEFTGVEFGDTEEIKLSNSGSDEMKVTIPTLSGGDLTLYAFYSTSGGPTIGLGKDADHKLIVDANDAIYKNYQFIVNDDKSSHLIKVTKLKDTTTDDKVSFEDVGLGNKWEVTTNATGYGTFDVDGREYSFVADYTNEYINMSGSASPISAGVIWTASEAKVTVSTNGTQGNMTFTEYDGGTADDSNVKRSITALVEDDAGTTTGIEVVSVSDDDPYSPSLQGWESNDDLEDTYTRWGTHVEYNNPSNGQASVTLTYPKNEATADVYIASGVTSTVAGSGEVGGLTQVEVASAVLDSEVADWKATNVIVVGGPCVNTVAAELMGNPADCAADFEEGKAKIKLFEDENVALLVAGYSADDTRRACTVLKNYKDYAADLVGSEVEMTATSDEDIVLAAPVVPEPEPEEPAE